MKWNAEEIEKYENARTYIDTVIIPVYHLQVEEIGRETYGKVQRLQEVCSYIESQVKGRALLLPVWYQFAPGLDMEHTVSEILNQQTFTHVLFVTIQKEMYDALREVEDVYVFDVSDDEITSEDQQWSVVEIGNRGYECLLKIWKK